MCVVVPAVATAGVRGAAPPPAARYGPLRGASAAGPPSPLPHPSSLSPFLPFVSSGPCPVRSVPWPVPGPGSLLARHIVFDFALFGSLFLTLFVIMDPLASRRSSSG